MRLINLVHISLEAWGTLFSLIAAIFVIISPDTNRIRQKHLFIMLLMGAALMVADALAWTFRGNESSLGYVMVRVSNFCVFVLGYVIMVCFTRYCCDCMPQPISRKALGVKLMIYLLALVGIGLVILTQYNGFFYYFDETNTYHRSSLGWLSQVIGIVGIMLDLALVLMNRKNLTKFGLMSQLSYIILPATSMVILVFFYGISLMHIAIVVSIMFMFISSQIEQSRAYVDQQKKLNEMRIDLMISQIGPHFMFNSLSVIKYLCMTDPEKAAQAVDDFSSYLRTNFDSLTEKKCVDFQSELEHTQHYLSLEKLRFGKRVNVEFEIEETDFHLPVLTLQPIVENAIKHGITKRPEGGTVKISTKACRTGGYLITVQDNGVGFDPKLPPDGPGAHIGVKNVTERLHSMCGGELYMTSKVGEGTKVQIFIPEVEGITK